MDFSSLKPALGLIALEVYNQFILPELQKLDGQVSSPDLKIVADALLAAIEDIAKVEVPKL